MDSRLHADAEGVRISNSPRRSPLITHGLTSPARSVYPEMESLHSQPDFGHRTADFFDDTSDDEAGGIVGHGRDDGADVDPLDKRRSGPRKQRQPAPMSEPFVSQCEGRRGTSQPDAGGYHAVGSAPQEGHIRFARTPTESFAGSVDELLPHSSSPPRFQHTPRIPSGRPARTLAPAERPDEQSPVASARNDQLLAAHAIAHEITLQSLMRDEEALEGSGPAFAPLESGYRASCLPPSLRTFDPRSPRTLQSFASPHSASSKRVAIVPPPIDTSAPHRALPADLVRTPYPFTPTNIHHKDFGRSPPSAISTLTPTSDSILTLSIRRSNPNSRRRVTTLTFPAPNDFSTTATPTSPREKDQHFAALDFDDAAFFRQLRKRYAALAGPAHALAARSLVRIAVSGPASKAADAGYGWIHQPRSPRVLAYRGLSDSFSEEKLWLHYRRPALGRSRYAFVQWAHRVATAPPAVRTPLEGEGVGVGERVERDLVRRMEQPEGLEFVVGWSVVRIGVALSLVGVVSVAAALLWVFLGTSTVVGGGGGGAHGGFRDAGDRVGAGVVMGICLLLLGLSGVGGWLGISWLVM
ncbi:hypothetical protein LTR08_004715 [Meristemomyces frigidus]|nr:hypothetical protein LTR08_004715 [Meristemomyces frigidus]